MFKALTPIIGIIVAVGLFFTYIKPTFEEVKGIQAETAEYTTAVDKAAELQRRITELKNQKEGIQLAELERLEAMLPDKIDEVSVLIDLSALADAHHLLFSDIEVGGSGGGNSAGDASAGKSAQPKPVSAPASLPAGSPPAPAGTPVATMPAGQNQLGGASMPGQSGLSAKFADQYSTLEIGFSVEGTYDDFRAFLEDLERSLVLMEVTSVAFGSSEGDSIPFSVTIRLHSLNPPVS